MSHNPYEPQRSHMIYRVAVQCWCVQTWCLACCLWSEQVLHIHAVLLRVGRHAFSTCGLSEQNQVASSFCINEVIQQMNVNVWRSLL